MAANASLTVSLPTPAREKAACRNEAVSASSSMIRMRSSIICSLLRPDQRTNGREQLVSGVRLDQKCRPRRLRKIVDVRSRETAAGEDDGNGRDGGNAFVDGASVLVRKGEVQHHDIRMKRQDGRESIAASCNDVDGRAFGFERPLQA